MTLSEQAERYAFTRYMKHSFDYREAGTYNAIRFALVRGYKAGYRAAQRRRAK